MISALELIVVVLGIGLLGFAGWTWRRLHTCQVALKAVSEHARIQSTQIDTIFGGMVDGITVVDADLRLVRWNPQFSTIAGVPADILRVGLEFEHILRAQAIAGEFGAVDVEAEVARRKHHLRAGVSVGTIERVRPNGMVMELRRSPLPGGGLVTLYTDVTGTRRAEEQLRQAQKMEAVGQLTSGIAHDFNNLLAVILGNLELADSNLHDADLIRVQQHIASAQGGARRAATLIARLLAFARQQHLQPVPLDVNKVVADMSELIRHSLGRDLHLETVLAGGLWEAVADCNQLESALLNLAVNARDAIGEDGKITIETANTHLDAAYAAEHQEVTPGQFVLVAVSDNGKGMTPEEIDRAFEPFFTTKEIGKGSGLGLSQVFGFIKQSGGHVKIYSVVGVGTTVKLYLPRLHRVPEEPAEAGGSEPRLAYARGQELVLLVEDDPDVLNFAAEAMRTLGYRVIAAKDAATALPAIRAHADISLLLTDVELPDLKGQELAKKARQIRPHLSVLLMTGYLANDMVHRGILHPGMGLLSKPFTLMQLASSIREALDTQGLQAD